MPIRVKCENCKKTLSVKDHLAGKKIKCPVCQNALTVSATAPAKDTPATPVKGSPAGKPAAPAASTEKKAAAATKTAKTAKPAGAKPHTNGTPGNGKAAPTNGTPAADAVQGNGKKDGSPQDEKPPEHVEAEALAAFADEPKPVEEETTPKTIDFICQWCDEKVSYPADMAGKQTPCTNPECRRIIKVPLPKVEGKKDWRKMDRQGPAAARINQPEELENAWGTENTTRARQDSLRQAGAIEEPEKEPLGVVGWMLRGAYVCIGILLVSGAVVGLFRLRSNNQQYQAIEDIKELVKGNDPKIKNPLLLAEAHRALGVLYLREPDRAKRSMEHLQGAAGMIGRRISTPEKGAEKNPFINEQLFLIDVALAQVDMGGSSDDVIAKKRQPWEEVRKELQSTLSKIQAPEAQVMALREVGNRLIEAKKEDLAFQLAGNLGNAEPGVDTRPAAYRQEIAFLIAAKAENQAKKDLLEKKLDPKAADLDPNIRVGLAEGHARNGDFDLAHKFATAAAAPLDRLDACLGVAFIALNDPKNKAEADKFLTEALAVLAKEKTSVNWQQLQAVKLAARLDKADSVKDLMARMEPPFKLRAQYEIFLAKCERGNPPATAEDLAAIEAEDPEGTTLGLAWLALTRENGATRSQNRKTFEGRGATLQKNVTSELVRPMVDVGTYLQSKK